MNVKTYTTIQGDTWDAIAYKLTGRDSFMTKLMSSNPDHIATVVFSGGIRLTVPEIDSEINSDLPPWRVGGEVV